MMEGVGRVAGFLAQFASSRRDGALVIGIHDTTGQFQREPAIAVPVLPDEKDMIVRVQRDDMGPIGIFENVIWCDVHTLIRDAIVGTQADPTIAMDMPGGSHPPGAEEFLGHLIWIVESILEAQREQ